MKLTDQQGQRLTQMMLSMRPDWIPNKPGTVLLRANEDQGFPAADFGHCIRALAAYATDTHPDGSFVKRTPDIYPEHGRHWTTTAPNGHEAPPARPCGDHDTEPAHNCRSCKADVLAGDRPENMIGKRTTPTVTPGRSPRPNRVRADPAEANPAHRPSDGPPPPQNDPDQAIPHPAPTEAPE